MAHQVLARLLQRVGFGPIPCSALTHNRTESIADRTRRPLYVLGAGDLGGFGSRVETKLNNAMHLATKWNAAILIDEADVFMEERTDNEILRNELVSGKIFTSVS